MRAVVILFLMLGFLGANALGVNASAAPAGRDQAASSVVVCADPPGYTLCRNGKRVSYERFTSITPTLAPYAIARLGEGKEAIGVYVDMRTGESLFRAWGLEPIELVNGVAMGKAKVIRGRDWGILLRFETCRMRVPESRFAKTTVSDCVFSHREYDTVLIKYYGERAAYLIVGFLLLWGLWKFWPKVSRLWGGNSKEGGMSQFGDSYRSEDLGQGRIRFYVTPGSGNASTGSAIIMAGVLGFVVAWFLQTRSEVVTLSIWGVAFVFFVWLFRKMSLSMSANSRKAFEAEFVASPSGIEVSGKALIPTASIHRLIMRNGFLENPVVFASAPGLIAGGTGAAGVGAAIGAAAGGALANYAQASAQAGRGRNALTGYYLDAESGGVATTLAGGMSETTAYGLLQDVGNALGL